MHNDCVMNDSGYVNQSLQVRGFKIAILCPFKHVGRLRHRLCVW